MLGFLAISPASGSYNETAHALRFAQRVQSVVNRPVVNEDPVARIIRELEGRGGQVKVFIARRGKSSFQYQIRADTKSGKFENTRSAEISTPGGARGKGENTMKSFGNTHTLDREFFKRFSLKMVLIKLSSKRRYFSSTRFRD